MLIYYLISPAPCDLCEVAFVNRISISGENVMNKHSAQIAGFVVLATVALFFGATYQIVQGAFAQHGLVLKAALQVVLVVGLACWSVEMSVFLPRTPGFLLATLIFGVCYWWAQPVVSWIALGVVDGQGALSDNATWSNHLYQFGRPDFWALALTSAGMVGVEHLRRLFTPKAV